ncbi:hypothetical protein M3A49_24350 [Paraburkholderia sp. CNPSo 3076]|uniref:hypothetical protein n=1 Tax=Paraburkholderia sp. CNPSo 3076 TaxID=2940936 RepID=UPI002259BEBB|nr:hypothetical protein [Paraburkholderia sp. CNPSo 3076]MCX5542592.1 hypothetical protein [Paraburkholderia sp. CNPSo 3076]
MDDLFGPSNAKEEPATSPLAHSRDALPSRAEAAEKSVDAPSPGDIARNSADLGSGVAREVGLFVRAVGHAAAGAVEGIERVNPFDPHNDPASIVASRASGRAQAPTIAQMLEGEVDRRTPEPATSLERGVEKVTEFAASLAMPGLPGAARVTPISNRAAGLGSSLASTAGTHAGDAIGQLSDGLFRTTRSAEARMGQWVNDLRAHMPKNWSEMAQRIDRSFEDASIKLSPEEEKMKLNVQLINSKNAKMREQLRAHGYDVGPDETGYVGSRVPVEQQGLLSTVRNVVPTGKARGLSTFAPELQGRKIFGMESRDPDAGQKNLHMMQNPNGTFTVWRNGEKIGGGKLGPDDLANREVNYMGERFALTPSTKAKIMEHTPQRYYEDPMLAAVTSNVRLGRALDHAQFLEQVKLSPEFRQIATTAREALPGWREVQIPQFRGMKFDPRAADVLDDFAYSAHQGGYKVLHDVSRALVGSMFWNPLPHAFNISDFGLIERGLVGNIGAVARLPQEVRMMLKAHEQVATLGPDYRAAIKEGAGLQHAANMSRGFADKLAKQLGTAPEMSAVARAWGYANPLEMIRRVYASANAHLWSWSDTLMMHAYYARQAKGASLPEAIKETESIMPNYRLPSRILGSRAVAQVMQVVPTFARYDYGRFAAYGNISKSLVRGSPQEKARALDRLAMLAVSSFVIYPALDRAVQTVTGDPNARVRRFGLASIPDAIYRFASGDAKYSSLFGAIMGVSPVFSVPTALATGEDPFTGKKFQNLGDAMKFAAEQISPVQTAMEYQGLGGRKTGGELLAEQLGIQVPATKRRGKKQEDR